MIVPEYIQKKIKVMNNHVEHALKIKREIETWAQSKGAVIDSEEWNEEVVDPYYAANQMYETGISDYFDSLDEE